MKAYSILATTLAVILGSSACSLLEPGDEPRSRDSCASSRELVELTRRGYFPRRSPDILVIPSEPNFVGTATNPPHTGAWPFLVNVPLVLYGPGFVLERGEIGRHADMVDLAPTTAQLIGFARWRDRAGRVLSESLRATDATPDLVVSVVWDGAGWNALQEHPGEWPFLRSMMKRGTTYTNFSVGSNPSVTPPIHATLGTGAHPDVHGITGVSQRTTRKKLVDPWAQFDSKLLRVATLADLYDRARSNRPLTGLVARVNWHLGMIGHGASLRGADRDEVVLLEHSGRPQGNEIDYSTPDVLSPSMLERFARNLDAEDGKIDGEWLRHPLSDPGMLGNSPAFTRYQALILRRMIDRVGFGADDTPDLLYVNMKETDLSYHEWGMESREVGVAIRAQDDALRSFVSHLDEHVGVGNWVVMVTADHGMMPDPADSGAYPIKGQAVLDDINARFDTNGNSADLAFHMTAYGVYIDQGELTSNDVDPEGVGRWLADYTLEDNASRGELGRFEDRRNERLFEAVTVGTKRVDPCDEDP